MYVLLSLKNMADYDIFDKSKKSFRLIRRDGSNMVLGIANICYYSFPQTRLANKYYTPLNYKYSGFLWYGFNITKLLLKCHV